MVRQVNPFALLDGEDSEDLTSVLAKVEANLAKLKNAVPQDHARSPQGADVPAAGRGRGRGRSHAGENARRNAGGGDGFQNVAGRGEGENGGWRSIDRSRGRGRSYFHGRGYGNGHVRWHAGVELAEEGGEIDAANGEVGLEQGSHVQVNGNGGGEYRLRGGYNGVGRGLRGRGGGGRWYGRGGRWVAKEEASGETKEGTGEPTAAVNGESGSDGAIVTEVAEQPPVESGKVEVVSEKTPVEKVADEEENKMTLLEYEKLLFEKRKALEIVKNEGRQVDEKDFEGMQIVDRKKEDDTVVKVKPVKEKPNKVSTDKEKPHKVRDTMSINEFLKPMKGARYYGPPSYARVRYAERLNNIKAEEKDVSVDVGQQPTMENRGMENSSLSNGVGGPQQSSNVPIYSTDRPDTEIQLADSKQFPGLTPAAKA